MSLDREPMMLLSQKLAGGYHLNAQLQALLGRPLDSRRQEEAMAFSQELSRVFMESMSVLKHANSDRLDVVRTAPEIIMTGNSTAFSAPTKDKRISGQDATPLKRSREEEEVTRKEITTSPHKDGYQWRKYGQKNIQNCLFPRYYYRCNRDRCCAAKKKVQQQDNGSACSDGPMFEVTYVNEHTCHALPSNDHTARITSPKTTSHALGVVDSSRNGSSDLMFPHIGGGSVDENEAIVSCLATVISGTAPSPRPPAEAGASDPPAYVPPGSSMADEMMVGIGFSCDPLSFCPGGAAELFDHCDMHMDVPRTMDTVWPRHT
ncbi:WRKY DNA-binding transcription factor 70-like [Phragmites australis]|uniref:WRKY DNA-binding transcription factor 70-like n=1 Tax=Phragmites australis TaxID=29695 RepID=UPI002D77AC96|nr:WRKY DNA-binding transcription factor 70-like [Phragmites australis]